MPCCDGYWSPSRAAGFRLPGTTPGGTARWPRGQYDPDVFPAEAAAPATRWVLPPGKWWQIAMVDLKLPDIGLNTVAARAAFTAPTGTARSVMAPAPEATSFPAAAFGASGAPVRP
jgi:hypothetical protein